MSERRSQWIFAAGCCATSAPAPKSSGADSSGAVSIAHQEGILTDNPEACFAQEVTSTDTTLCLLLFFLSRGPLNERNIFALMNAPEKYHPAVATVPTEGGAPPKPQ